MKYGTSYCRTCSSRRSLDHVELDIFAASPDSSFFPGEVGMEANNNTIFGGDRLIGLAADFLPPNKHHKLLSASVVLHCQHRSCTSSVLTWIFFVEVEPPVCLVGGIGYEREDIHF